MVRRGAVTCGPATLQDGATALIWAAGDGHTYTVELLLGRGADLEAKDNVKPESLLSLPFVWSAGCMHIGCIELLLETSDS